MPNNFFKSTSPSTVYFFHYYHHSLHQLLLLPQDNPQNQYFLPNAILGRGLFRQIVKNSWDKWDSPNASFSMKALLLLVIFIGKEQIDLLDAL